MTNLRQNTINPRLVCPHPAYHPVHPHMFMINHHLQPCVIPHLLTEISESKHHQVVKQVDLGCKGSNPNSLVYPGLPIEMNLMAGMERELTKEVHTTQIEDIMEADLEIWIGIIIETTETIAEMTEGTIVGMIGVEDIAEVIETITDEIVEETPDVIEIIVIEAGIEVEIDPGIAVENVAGIEAETAAGSDPATTAIGKGQIRIDTEIDLVMKQNYPVTGRKSKLRRKFPSF